MNSLDKLSELFSKFPGIGPRQAKRFVYFLLRQKPEYRNKLTEMIADLGKHARLCKDSFAYFYSENELETKHPIARDPNRDDSKLLIVERDSDLDAIEKSRVYDGRYFVLGGTLPILDKEPEKKIRINELLDLIERKNNIKEIILATSANPDGDYTKDFVQKKLDPLTEKFKLKISLLGRGLSTGTEIEYSDTNTLAEAFQNRK